MNESVPKLNDVIYGTEIRIFKKNEPLFKYTWPLAKIRKLVCVRNLWQMTGKGQSDSSWNLPDNLYTHGYK